jgi:hypothetical protein
LEEPRDGGGERTRLRTIASSRGRQRREETKVRVGDERIAAPWKLEVARLDERSEGGEDLKRRARDIFDQHPVPGARRAGQDARLPLELARDLGADVGPEHCFGVDAIVEMELDERCARRIRRLADEG